MISKTKKFVQKDRKIMDTTISIDKLIGHILVNFTYALISGLLLAIIPTKNYLYICITYFIFKRFEGVILKRGGYTSKLGNRYIYPIPSCLGFLVGVYISEILMN